MAKTTLSKAEMREKVESLVKDFNDKLQNGDYENAAKVNKEIEENVNEYTAMCRKECFDYLAGTENPMIEAVKMLSYPTIRIKDTKQGEEKIPVRIVEDIERAIDLLKLHKHVGGDGIGAAKNWVNMAEKFNLLMTAQKAVDLGIDPKLVHDSYAMSEISKEIDMGKTPTSKTNILKTLNMVIAAMIGEEYKAKSHDVNFLLSIYSRKNRKALTVSCANHKYMRQYLAEICHRIILDKSYEIEFKKVR